MTWSVIGGGANMLERRKAIRPERQERVQLSGIELNQGTVPAADPEITSEWLNVSCSHRGDLPKRPYLLCRQWGNPLIPATESVLASGGRSAKLGFGNGSATVEA